MLTLSISPKAEADLIDIWLYVAEDQPVNADRLLDRLNDKALSLAETPGMGAARPSLSKGLKCFPVGSYILYYRTTISELQLVRVLSASRDMENIHW